MKKLQVPNKIWLLIIATIVLVVFLFVSIFYFGSKYQEDIKNYTIGTIEKHVLEQNLYFDALINNQFDELTNISKFVDLENVEESLPLLNFTEIVNGNEGLVNFVIFDINGHGMLSDGTSINFNANSNFKDCLNGDRVIIKSSEISNDDQDDDIIIMIPMYIDNMIIGTMGAYYKTDYLSRVLIRDTAKLNEFFCVANNDGKIIFSNNTTSDFYLSTDFNKILQQITFVDFAKTDTAFQSPGALMMNILHLMAKNTISRK